MAVKLSTAAKVLGSEGGKATKAAKKGIFSPAYKAKRKKASKAKTKAKPKAKRKK